MKRPTSSRVGRKAPGTYHHGDLRRALLDAALLLIERDGPGALTLRAAARLAGVSQTAPYRHFTDKEALLAALAEEGLREMGAWMVAARSKEEGSAPQRRMGVLGVTYVRYAAAHRAHFRVMFGPVADHPSVRAAAEVAFELLLVGVLECQEAGVVHAGDPRRLALAAWSIVHGLAALCVDGQLPHLGIVEKDPVALAEQMTATLFNGLSARR